MNQIKTDILIIGGGSAGIAAAVAASLEGNSVVLVDSNKYLGGNATASEVGTVCGLYHRNQDADSKYVVDGFAKEFSDKLQTLSATVPVANRDGLHYLPYSIESFRQLAMEYLKKNNIQVLLETRIVDIEVRDGLAKNCTLNKKEEVISLKFDSIVDCSGCSIISRLANIPVIESDSFQSAALVFSMKNVRTDNVNMLNLIVIKHLRKAVLRGEIDSSLESVFIVPGSLKNERVSFKVAIPVEVTLTKNNLSYLRKKGKEMVEKLVQFFIQDIGVFDEAELDHIADEVGIRTSYRSIGKYVLTEQDVLVCRKFENSIANCSWPIEEWSPFSKVKMDFLPANDFYQIPKDCLISNHISNLFLGGKNISATDRAIGSARVMGACFQTGYAAGILACEFAKENSKNLVLITDL